MGKIINENEIIEASGKRFYEILSSHITFIERGKTIQGKCPYCGHDNGYQYNKAKNIVKCFHCNEKADNNGFFFLMHAFNMRKDEALRTCAQDLCMHIEEEQETKPVIKPQQKVKSFLQQFLEGSGLTSKDVEATLPPANNDETNKYAFGSVFKKGTVTLGGEIDLEGNDVIIEYYDLDGYPCRYKAILGKKEEVRTYFRVRWANPEAHLNKEGKSYKYQSPKGSTPFLYIPQKMRALYKAKTKLDTLYIHEGEKKAEKAMKHGIPSVAISGIANIAMTDRATGRKFLSEDLIRIITELEVKNIVMVYDSDYKEISKNVRITDELSTRPYCFYKAAKNFADYIRDLKKEPLAYYANIFIAAISPNQNADKGIDDLLVNTLKGQEDELRKDFDYFILDKDHKGKFIEGYKITDWSDNKLKEVWSLDHPQKFAKAHAEILRNLPEFKIFGHSYKIDEHGQIVSATPIERDEEFWQDNSYIDAKSGKEVEKILFNYTRCERFLLNHGFARLKRNEQNFIYIRMDKPFVTEVSHYTMRDYVLDFTRTFLKEPVYEMLKRGGNAYFGPDKMSTIPDVQPKFYKATKDHQRIYFDDRIWEINDSQIHELNYADVDDLTWIENRQPYKANKTGKLFNIHKNKNGFFEVEITPTGKACHMLTFLRNTSDFSWRLPKSEITEAQNRENNQHLVAKLCAIGYLLTSFKDPGNARAVILMDGKQAEVGASNGRTGKSLVGEMLKRIMPTAMINGKGKGPAEDAFIWTNVSEKTRLVFVDDVRVNFSLEDYFVYITSDWTVNCKGKDPVVYPFSDSPKILITTNHAINGNTSSFKDRRWLVAFSDWYNESHKPVDDFGCRLFDDWDFEQWSLLWNMLAQCIQLYMQLGVVQSPEERLEKRMLRQEMGENFLSWADEYFSDTQKINIPIPKKTLYDTYLAYYPEDRKFSSPTKFKRQIEAWIKYHEYVLNPQMRDPKTGKAIKTDKDGREDFRHCSNGIEYITVGVKWNESEINFGSEDVPKLVYNTEPTEKPQPFE